MGPFTYAISNIRHDLPLVKQLRKNFLTAAEVALARPSNSLLNESACADSTDQ